MSKHTARMPVRFIPGNQDLLKSQVGTATEGPGWSGQREGTDYRPNEEPVSTVGAGVCASYRSPSDRVNGNALFRRYPNGDLDIVSAVHCVVDALHRAKESGGMDQLNSLEKVALSVLFPTQFTDMDPMMVSSVAAVQLRLSPLEIMQVRGTVARHLAEELNWNAGRGGGSVPGRSDTRNS